MSPTKFGVMLVVIFGIVVITQCRLVEKRRYSKLYCLLRKDIELFDPSSYRGPCLL